MKSLLLTIIISIAMVEATNAQDNIVGMYSLGGASPEGGSHLIVLENGKYAIMYFGRIQAGNWEHTQNNVYRFTPNPSKNQFELYGRHNKNLGEEIRVQFNGFENGETFIHLGAANDEVYTMKRVFNIGANGFSFPYVYTVKSKGDVISFMSKSYHQGGNTFATFKGAQEYNDFVANFFGEDHVSESRPFTATFKEDRLYFEDDNGSPRSPLDEDDEEITEIMELIAQEMDREMVYFNPSYNRFGGDINEYHVFNEEKGAYIDEEYYDEGEEDIASEDSYDSMSIIYAFKVLKDRTTEPVEFIIDENPIFQVGGN